MQKTVLVGILACALLALAACDFEDMGISSERYTTDFHYSYPLKPGGRISLESFNGSVEISGWDQNSVDISGHKYAGKPELRDAIRIDIVASDEAVQIRTIRPSERRGNMGASYVIKVPRQTRLDRIGSSNGGIRAIDVEGPARLKTSNGSVHTSNLRGDLEVQTSNGTVEVVNLQGGAVLKTSNGRIRAEGIRGDFEAITSNGGINVKLAESEPGRPVKLETSNGGIDLTLDGLNQRDVRASTSNGGVTVHLPADLNARLRAHTSNSSIKTDFDVRIQGNVSKTQLDGVIGTGGPLIDLSTSNGSIRLLKL